MIKFFKWIAIPALLIRSLVAWDHINPEVEPGDIVSFNVICEEDAAINFLAETLNSGELSADEERVNRVLAVCEPLAQGKGVVLKVMSRHVDNLGDTYFVLHVMSPIDNSIDAYTVFYPEYHEIEKSQPASDGQDT